MQSQTTWHHLSSDWINWADRLAPAAEKINRHLIEAADLDGLARLRGGAPLDVLDLASGVGEPAFSFARVLGGNAATADDVSANTPGLSGHVTASDIVPEMCDGLAARAADEGIGNISVIPADMEKLPFSDQSFDVVSCRFGVMFCNDPDRALGESHRVLRPGGRAVYMVWAPMVDNPLFAAMDAVLGNILGIGFDKAGINPFAFGHPDQSMMRLEAAGFTGITATSHSPAGRIPEKVPFWKPQMDMLFGNVLRRASDMDRGAIDAAMFETLSPYIEDGHFQVPICFHVLSGKRA
ncbi:MULTISPECIES: class I SAM-dependent methyltransferase [Thalassospira]|uniref:Methyltransferase domain-containing protein n=1 Tax=Thalassospira aquimaris TaxID=3037796 RepID=A0ABT6G823_9PROT|nr:MULTISPECIES: methyltransferase domain-containing protein [Thalassospira]MDG4718183.1 methyltransferase domain-containing protein [Thalassospira sp. FZY0004]